MYYLESKEPQAAGSKLPTVWRKLCYCNQREPLDEAVEALGSENYRVTRSAERRST